MSNTKFNIYYATSPTGPWTLANTVPLDRVEGLQSYIITGLKTNALYYVSIVGGVLNAQNNFVPLISQPIGPNPIGAGNQSNCPVSPLGIKTFSPQITIESVLGHMYALPLPPIVRENFGSATGGAGGVNSLVVPLGSVPSDGNTLIMMIGTQSTSVVVNSITQTGAVWVKAIDARTPANGTNLDIWYAQNVQSALDDATVNLSGYAQTMGVITEYSGLLASGSVLDKTSAGFLDVVGSPADTGMTALVTQNDELFIAGVNNIPNRTYGTPTNGFGLIAAQTAGIDDMEAYDKIVTAIETAGTQVSLTPTGVWAAAVATFRKAI